MMRPFMQRQHHIYSDMIRKYVGKYEICVAKRNDTDGMPFISEFGRISLKIHINTYAYNWCYGKLY